MQIIMLVLLLIVLWLLSSIIVRNSNFMAELYLHLSYTNESFRNIGDSLREISRTNNLRYQDEKEVKNRVIGLSARSSGFSSAEEILTVWDILPKTISNNIIHPDKYIKVVSLCKNSLHLSPRHTKFTPKIEYNFDKLGDFMLIKYAHLIELIESYPRFAEKPYYCIMNKDVAIIHHLDEIYINELNNIKG